MEDRARRVAEALREPRAVVRGQLNILLHDLQLDLGRLQERAVPWREQPALRQHIREQLRELVALQAELHYLHLIELHDVVELREDAAA